MSFPTQQAESLEIHLHLGLLLRDGFADSDQLVGNVIASTPEELGYRKDQSGTFLFFSLKTGPQSISVSSDAQTPYYVPINVSVTTPMPSLLWPAFPDVTLADPTLPLGDVGQKPAYKAQRQSATLWPATTYPFPPGSTLIRGTVTHLGIELAGALAAVVGSDARMYTTGEDGQFVLFVDDAPGVPTSVTVKVQHAGLADVSINVTILRGRTVSIAVTI